MEWRLQFDRSREYNGENLVTAIRSNPLVCAAKALRNIYIATALPTFALLLLVRDSIKKHFPQPIAEIARAAEENWRNLYRPEPAPAPNIIELHGGRCFVRNTKKGGNSVLSPDDG